MVNPGLKQALLGVSNQLISGSNRFQKQLHTIPGTHMPEGNTVRHYNRDNIPFREKPASGFQIKTGTR